MVAGGRLTHSTTIAASPQARVACPAPARTLSRATCARTTTPKPATIAPNTPMEASTVNRVAGNPAARDAARTTLTAAADATAAVSRAGTGLIDTPN